MRRGGAGNGVEWEGGGGGVGAKVTEFLETQIITNFSEHRLFQEIRSFPRVKLEEICDRQH